MRSGQAAANLVADVNVTPPRFPLLRIIRHDLFQAAHAPRMDLAQVALAPRMDLIGPSFLSSHHPTRWWRRREGGAWRAAPPCCSARRCCGRCRRGGSARARCSPGLAPGRRTPVAGRTVCPKRVLVNSGAPDALLSGACLGKVRCHFRLGPIRSILGASAA